MSEPRPRRTRLSKRTTVEDNVEEPMEPDPEPLRIRKSTRRTSVTTVSRSHANGGLPQASVLAQSYHVDGRLAEEHEAATGGRHVGGAEGAGEHGHVGERDRDAKPALSDRLRDAAATVGDKVQDTLASAWHAAPALGDLDWPTLGSLLGLVLLTSLLTAWASHLLNPVQRQMGTVLTSMETVAGNYKVMDNKISEKEGKMQIMQHNLDEMWGKVATLEREWEKVGKVVGHKPGEVRPVDVATLAEERARAALQAELSAFEADRTGMADYAMAAGGGRVTAHSPLAYGSHAPATYHLRRLAADALQKLPLLGRLVPRTPVHPHADEFLLSPGVAAARCLALRTDASGGGAFVEFDLRTPIEPLSFTYEHAPLTFEPDSTPQRLVVKGSLRPAVRFDAQGTAKIGGLQRRNGTELRTLGDLDYTPSLAHQPRSAVQTFALAGGPAVDHVRVEVHSNYGNLAYTCLYRMRVHGIPVHELADEA
ncbi:hypothetical protein WJX81_001966 [Elliptochloris bilobata]|uniref:SUN domain-containing protein n=1 Tax=Elliptochloris bilobata TaxID=381761 RepID=A0AAW1QUP2_9CHLO